MQAVPFLTIEGAAPAGDSPSPSDSHARHAPALPVRPSDLAPVRPLTDAAREKGHLASASGDPCDLRLQRWGIVAPEGAEGDALLDAVSELAAHRAAQQGEAPIIYRVRPGMDTAAAEAFIDGEYWDKVERKTERLPRYLLLLGEAAGVSWPLQQTLARHGTFPGRLSFRDLASYRAYAAKVVRWETAPLRRREALFYIARDGSSAVESARAGFLAPTAESVAEAASRDVYGAVAPAVQSVGLVPAARPEEELESMLSLAAKGQGATLVSVSHGLGITTGTDPADRRARQGGLSVSQRCTLLADRVRTGPFLPGGAWFFFACFSAGTPAESVYRPWLLRLRGKEDHHAERVLSTLPGPTELPFVAALPEAALANPDGPLAVVGHVDLAWSWSFAAVRDGGAGDFAARSERLSGLLHAWLRGDRFGPAHHVLSSAATSVGETLLSRQELEAAGKAPPGEDWQSQTAYLWLEYQDLNGHVLLGDPAAALPGSRLFAASRLSAAAEGDSPARASDFTNQASFVNTVNNVAPAAAPLAASAVSSADLDLEEQAVLRVLASPAEADKLARRLGTDPAELLRRAEVYRAAGRAALAAHLASGATSRASR